MTNIVVINTYDGKLCFRCGTTQRYTNSGSCIECIRVYNNILRRRPPWHSSLRNARARCVQGDIDFDLTYDWAKRAWNNGRCSLTNIQFDLTPHNGKFNPYSPSLDRIDNKLGYIQTNCRFILFCINAFKSIGSDEDMYYIAEQLTRNRGWRTT